MSIQAIDQSSVHRLTSGQVVIDLQTAVKELLENALDAGATSVEVRFKEYGVDAIEVQDNGRGIEQSDWAGIALKHHTSKLSTYADLDQVITLGFRGEALSSLCGTAELSVATSTATTAPAGTSLTFARSGECIVGGKVARSKGTTVTVKELFKTLPVRRKDLIKNAKREFGKAVELVQSYAVIKTGCRIEVKNSVKGKWTTHLQTQSAVNVRGNFSSLFTPKALVPMMDLDLVLDVAADKSVLKWSEGAPSGATQVLVKGLISKPTTGSGRTSGNRQFYYVNGRPFTPSKVAKAVNEAYRSFNTGSFPCIVADFQLPPDAYDVNVSPDKRTIFLHSEGNLIAALTTALTELFQPSRSTYSMAQIGAPKASTSASTQLLLSRKRASSPSSSKKLDRDESESADEEEAEETPDEEEQEEEVQAPPAKRRRGSSLASDDLDLDTPAASSASTASPSETEVEPDQMEVEEDEEAPPLASSPRVAAATLFLADVNDSDDEADEPHAPIASTSSPPLSQRRPSAPTSPSVSRSPSPAPPPKSNDLRQVTLDTSFAAWSQNPKPVTSRADKGKGKAVPSKPGGDMKEKVKSLRQFFNPTQPQPLSEPEDEDELRSDMDAEDEQEADNGDEEEEEEEEERGEDLFGASMHKDYREDPILDRYDATDLDDEGDFSDPEDARAHAEAAMKKRDSAAESEEEEEEDDLLVVEDSFRASQPADSSCACDHTNEAIELSDDSDSDEPSTPAHEAERVAHLAALDADASASVRALDEILGLQRATAADTTVSFDMAALVAHWTAPPRAAAAPSWATQAARDPLAGASVEQDVEQAEDVLSRVVSKEDFGNMTVVGQFNLGFIIARRTVRPDDDDDAALAQDDLFIVDQHASDEKYNFERLQQDTVIQSQRLLQPRSLNLPSHEEITALDNVDILKMNGFEVLVDEDAPVGQRVKLTAQPVSKDTVWGVADLEELLDLINSSATGEVVRPTKTRKMFASRACRKSVMIGKALNKAQMTSVVRHMGGMDQPWACPHGRPTMRWLAGLGSHTTDDRADVSAVLQAYA